MKNEDFYAVVMAGGSGERFWPLSTPERPKQFLSVFGGKSLLRQTADRLAGLLPPERMLVVTAASLVGATRRELPELPAANIVGEPCRRDTAAAAALATAIVARRGGERAVCALLPADQLVSDARGFRKVLADAAKAARSTGAIVTVGIRPVEPSTAFGYVRVGKPVVVPGAGTAFRKADKFVEKPDLRTARRYLASGKYAWNAGMFVFRADAMRAEIARSAPGLTPLASLVAFSPAKLSRVYADLPKISIDYAVMEKARHVVVADGDFGWDDVGTWSAAGKHLKRDAAGNVALGDVVRVDVDDSVLVSQGPRVAALGVSGLVVVATPDSVLVVPKSRAADLKKLFVKK